MGCIRPIRDYDEYAIATDTDPIGKCRLEPVKVKRHNIVIIRIIHITTIWSWYYSIVVTWVTRLAVYIIRASVRIMRDMDFVRISITVHIYYYTIYTHNPLYIGNNNNYSYYYCVVGEIKNITNPTRETAVIRTTVKYL